MAAVASAALPSVAKDAHGHVQDSWLRRAPGVEDLSPDRKTRILAFLGARKRGRGGATPEERMIAALVWRGLTEPLFTLGLEAKVSGPGARPDTVRRQAARVMERLEARGIVTIETVRLPFAACTHTRIQGTKGRLECQRLRAKRALGETCIAHHGFDVRTLAEGTAKEWEARLAIPKKQIAALVAQNKAEAREARQKEGRQGNDIEGRRWRGESPARGPRGTNHTSPRQLALRAACVVAQIVTPIPPEGLEDPDRSASFGGIRGDKRPPGRSGLPPTADAVPAPPAQETLFGERPPPAGDAVQGNRLEREGEQDSDRRREESLARLEAARPIAELRNWFLLAWAAAHLPPLRKSDRNCLWHRCQRFTRADLALAIGRAERAAGSNPATVFRRIFANAAVLAQLIDEERDTGGGPGGGGSGGGGRGSGPAPLGTLFSGSPPVGGSLPASHDRIHFPGGRAGGAPAEPIATRAIAPAFARDADAAMDFVASLTDRDADAASIRLANLKRNMQRLEAAHDRTALKAEVSKQKRGDS